MAKSSLTTMGRRLRKLRLEAGLSQQALAEGICTSAYVSHLEAGKRRPSDELLEKLAERLETTAEHLVTGRSPHAAAQIRLDIERIRLRVVQGGAAEGLDRAEELRDQARQMALPSVEGRAEEVIGRALLRLGRRAPAWRLSSARSSSFKKMLSKP